MNEGEKGGLVREKEIIHGRSWECSFKVSHRFVFLESFECLPEPARLIFDVNTKLLNVCTLQIDTDGKLVTLIGSSIGRNRKLPS